MHPITSQALHSTLAAGLIAVAATGAAAADAFLKLKGHKGEDAAAQGAGKGDWIDVQSFHWGPRQTTSADGSVQTPEAQSAKLQPGGGKAQGSISGGVRVASGDVTGDSARTSDKREASAPNISEIHVTKSMDTASPLIMKPLPQGSLTVKGKVPGCAVGKHYAEAMLQTAKYKYEFRDIIITSCAMSGGGGGSGSLPMEEISFNYGKITTVYTAEDKTEPKAKVRGWDPEKKEQ